MLRKVMLVFSLTCASAGIAFAGDTVTVNMPGGAPQTVFSGAIAAQITGATIPSESGVSVSAGTVTSGGMLSFSVTSAKGVDIRTTSSFIAFLVRNYVP